MRTTTPFDVALHHIHIRVEIDTGEGLPWRVKGLLDSGAPWTEVSDKFLFHAGLLDQVPEGAALKPGLETQKYGKLVLPQLRVCGQILGNFEVRVSRFEESWDIAALVGLDFFRRFPVTIDYHRAVLEVG